MENTVSDTDALLSRVPRDSGGRKKSVQRLFEGEKVT